jgi:hypothetical protein
MLAFTKIGYEVFIERSTERKDGVKRPLFSRLVGRSLKIQCEAHFFQFNFQRRCKSGMGW